MASQKTIPIVFIEGGIGCGKSTLVKHIQEYCLKHKLRFLTIQEPVDLWNEIKDESGKNMIEAFYEDQEKHAFAFQMMAYITRLQKLQEAYESAKDKYDLLVCERSLHTDKHVFCQMLYDEGKIDTYGYKIYNQWFYHFQSFIHSAMFVYLKTDHTVCYERIQKRQRSGESNISSEYLRKNNEYHDKWLLQHDNVMILDGNQDCTKNEDLLNIYCKQILDHVTSYLI